MRRIGGVRTAWAFAIAAGSLGILLGLSKSGFVLVRYLGNAPLVFVEARAFFFLHVFLQLATLACCLLALLAIAVPVGRAWERRVLRALVGAGLAVAILAICAYLASGARAATEPYLDPLRLMMGVFRVYPVLPADPGPDASAAAALAYQRLLAVSYFAHELAPAGLFLATAALLPASGSDEARGDTPSPRVPTADDDPGAPVRTYLVPAVLATLFCCLPFGIASIVYAARARGQLAAGDRAGAAASAAKARTWFWVSAVAGLSVATFYLLASIGTYY